MSNDQRDLPIAYCFGSFRSIVNLSTCLVYSLNTLFSQLNGIIYSQSSKPLRTFILGISVKPQKAYNKMHFTSTKM